MRIGTIKLASHTPLQYWENYLTVMQSVLHQSQRLTDKEIEILAASIVESSKEDREVFDPVIAKILSAKLNMTLHAIRMHKKNIRNKGWVKGNALEGLTKKIARLPKQEDVEVTIVIKGV